jgi:CheY-like chemotaxis protein
MDSNLLSGMRVLVVEDEMLVMMGIEDMLADLGCTSVTAAADLEKALSLIAGNRFDFATVDVNLGGTRSYPVAQALSDAGVPFAFSTGYGEDGVGEGFGDHPVLSKPFTSERFTEVMNILIARPNPIALPA